MGVVAVQAGLATVPTRTGDFADELEEIEMLISSNKQREKSKTQIFREGEELQRIESIRAERRKKASQFGTVDAAVESNRTPPGRTDELVAKELGLSTGTWKRLKLVFEKAKEGDENAQGLVKSLDAGTISVHGAYQEIKKQLDSEKGEKSRITKALEEAKKNLDEALQNPLTIEVENRGSVI